MITPTWPPGPRSGWPPELGWDDAATETEIMNYRKQHGSNGAPPSQMYGNGDAHANGLATAATGSKLGQR